MREWLSKFRALIKGRGGLDDDLAEEMRTHLDMEADRYMETGLVTEEARIAARRRLTRSTSRSYHVG